MVISSVHAPLVWSAIVTVFDATELQLMEGAANAHIHFIDKDGVAGRTDGSGDNRLLRGVSAFRRREAREVKAESPRLILRRADYDLAAHIIRAGCGRHDGARGHAVAGGEEHVAVGIDRAGCASPEPRACYGERYSVHHRRDPILLVRSS